jgi:hypothetical protein
VDPRAGLEGEAKRQMPSFCSTEVKYELGPLNVKRGFFLAFDSVRKIRRVAYLIEKNVTIREVKKDETVSVLACINVSGDHMHSDHGGQLPPGGFVITLTQVILTLRHLFYFHHKSLKYFRAKS